MASLSDAQVEAALRAIETDSISPDEKAEMLMEMAMGLQQRPKDAKQLEDAIMLYARAAELCDANSRLLRARIMARRATALRMQTSENDENLFEAYEDLLEAKKAFDELGLEVEAAEAEMNLGLIAQSLAQSGRGKLTDAIGHYHNALRTFNKDDFPQDFAILHNNLAIAYLSMPMSDERAKMREALAVQSFEEVLKVINIVDQPNEYAMIQNNLGNALQYASTSHALANNLRAIEAYDEALRVRTLRDTPMEYANTIANKANVLRNLPDDPEDIGIGNMSNLRRSRELYVEARSIFLQFGQFEGVRHINETLAEIDSEMMMAASAKNGSIN